MRGSGGERRGVLALRGKEDFSLERNQRGNEINRCECEMLGGMLVEKEIKE